MANTATAKAATDAPPWGRGLHNLHIICCNRNRYQHHHKDNRHNLLGRHFSLNTLLVSECVKCDGMGLYNEWGIYYGGIMHSIN